MLDLRGHLAVMSPAYRGSLRQGSAFISELRASELPSSTLRTTVGCHANTTNHNISTLTIRGSLAGKLHISRILPCTLQPYLQRCDPGKRSDRAKPAAETPDRRSSPAPFTDIIRSTRFCLPSYLHQQSTTPASTPISSPVSPRAEHMARQKGPSRDRWLSTDKGPWEKPCVYRDIAMPFFLEGYRRVRPCNGVPGSAFLYED